MIRRLLHCDMYIGALGHSFERHAQLYSRYLYRVFVRSMVSDANQGREQTKQQQQQQAMSLR